MVATLSGKVWAHKPRLQKKDHVKAYLALSPQTRSENVLMSCQKYPVVRRFCCDKTEKPGDISSYPNRYFKQNHDVSLNMTKGFFVPRPN